MSKPNTTTNEFFKMGTKALIADAGKGALVELKRRADKGSTKAEKALAGLTPAKPTPAKAKAKPSPAKETTGETWIEGGIVLSPELASLLLDHASNADAFHEGVEEGDLGEELDSLLLSLTVVSLNEIDPLASKSVKELRSLAKASGVKIPRGTNKATIIALLEAKDSVVVVDEIEVALVSEISF